MPMIEDGELHRHMAARASFDSGAALFDFFPEVERPLGVCSRSVQDRGNIVFQNYGREEANIDVARDLEDVFVLPELHVSFMPRILYKIILTSSVDPHSVDPKVCICHLR